MIAQVVFDTSKILSEKAVTHVVHSPGSRNAPLTVSLARNKDLKIYNIVDERSAGFIALGIAQKTKRPVVLCCTSGTSLLNYAPAIAEAYYQEIPLIILSADRPPEWHGQRDGQTIQQVGALRNFVLGEFQLPIPMDSMTSWEYTRKLNEGINLALGRTSGPVHINVPFREPFYPQEDQSLVFSPTVHMIHETLGESIVSVSAFEDDWKKAQKVLVVVGQQASNVDLSTILKEISINAVVVSDVISNIAFESIRYHDHFLASMSADKLGDLKPDLVISIGMSVISKPLKQFLRKFKPNQHWHIDQSSRLADTYQSMTNIIRSDPYTFLAELSKLKLPKEITGGRKSFVGAWESYNSSSKELLQQALTSLEFSEYTAFKEVISDLPDGIDLHLANSMPVRYMNLIPSKHVRVEVFSNRGTSGIDGTNGTAVGNAFVSEKPTYLLTGDLSFFYDRNAFFHGYDLSSLKIVVFNNQGGGIFRLIGGPSELPELEQHFETRHQHTARFLAEEFGFGYQRVESKEGIKTAMSRINSSTSPEILEILTDPTQNTEAFKKVKEFMKMGLS